MLFALAWRNLLRNWRRSLITIIGIAAGLTALVFLWGFNDGQHNRMMRNIQETLLGSLQVHRDGYFKHPRLRDHMEDAAPVVAALEANGIQRWTTRLRTFALAAGDDNSAGVMLMGIDPEREPEVTDMHSKIGAGRFIVPGDRRVCILGETAARNLGLKPGDAMVLLTQDRFDSLAAERFTLIGIIDSGEVGLDRGMAIIPLADAQQMLAMEGRITDVVALTPNDDVLDAVTPRIRAALEGQELEVLRWYDMFSIMKEWVRLDNIFFYIFIAIVLLIIVAGILNTMLASMLDRIHEFGVLMGIGAKGYQLGIIMMLESFMLAVAGIGLGAGAGLALVTVYGHVGIDLSGMVEGMERFYIDPVIYTEINTDHLLDTVLIMLAGTLLAALYPAWKASRLTPVEAIHHV